MVSNEFEYDIYIASASEAGASGYLLKESDNPSARFADTNFRLVKFASALVTAPRYVPPGCWQLAYLLCPVWVQSQRVVPP
jgi:hypothetical protein